MRARRHKLRYNSVLLKGTALAVPYLPHNQWGFSPGPLKNGNQAFVNILVTLVHASPQLKILYVRLMMKTVLSSISSLWPSWRSWRSLFTA